MARGEGNVVVRILGEARDLAQKLKQSAADVGQFASSSRNVIAQSFDDLASLVTSRFGRIGAEADKALGGIADKALATGSTVGLGVGAGAAAAGAGLVALGVQGIKSFVDLADKVRDFQRTSGAAAEESSRLVAVLDDLEIDAGTGAAAMFRLARNVNDNTDALEANGVQIARNADGTVNLVGTLLNVGDTYKRTADAAKRANIVQDAFGRGGAALIPILEKNRDVLEQMFDAADEHGEVLSQEDLDKAREFELALDDLQDAVGGLQRALGEGVIPALAGTARGMATAVDWANKLSKPIGGLKGLFRGVMAAANPLGSVLGMFGKKSDDAADSAEDAASAIGELTDEFSDQKSEAEAAADGLRAYEQAVRAAHDSVLGIPSAIDDVDQAFRDLQDHSEESTKRAAEAQDRLADAIEDANKRIRDAEQDVADAREDLMKISSGDRTDARRRLRDAEERLAEVRQESAEAIAEAKEDAAELAPSLGDASDSARDTREEMERVVTAVEKTVAEMIKQKRPTREILDYIIQQRDRLTEIGRQQGINRQDLELYLGTLTKVFEMTRDIANLGTAQTQQQMTPRQRGEQISDFVDLITNGITVNQTIYTTDSADAIARATTKSLNNTLRTRG